MDISSSFTYLFICRSLWLTSSRYFFLKDYLSLSASFIASIGFWAGIPWALKMPFGFLVDKFGKENYLVLFGAIIIFISILIMYLLISYREEMVIYLSADTWFIISSILTL